jgi:hypothetical protein
MMFQQFQKYERGVNRVSALLALDPRMQHQQHFLVDVKERKREDRIAMFSSFW